jgi:hypothetical protein
MGWLWGSGNSAGGQDDLDPSLRDFLKKEAPTGPKPTLPSPQKDRAADPSAPLQSQPQAQSQSQTEPSKPVVPPESQFPDGRYAHLWQGYEPHHVLANRGKSEQDKIRDLVDAYNDRKASIGRVAMENCALEYMEQFDCYRTPKTWFQAGTMCYTESRKFSRCYDIQSKFLKALGYMTTDARTEEESERIQMHADKLYQKMLLHEADVEKAKEDGLPIPKFESMLSNPDVVQALGGSTQVENKTSNVGNSTMDYEADIWKHINPESRKEYEKKLASLPPEEREVERMAVLGELKAQTGVSKKMEEAFVIERINRMKRKEAGQATLGDTIKSLWGWG